jgi:peptide deformylase
MFATMEQEVGIGLAAPQVGELIRLAIVDVRKQDTVDLEKFISDPVALINPEIIAGEGTISYEEGCLSCPELLVKVDRFNRVKVKYLDLEGRMCELTAEGLKAVCIQHELDHLNGILLADKISRLERNLYKSKLFKIAKDEKDLAKVL